MICFRAINEKIVAENNDKLKENKNLNEKISRLEKDSQEMVYTIESLNSEKKEKITTIQSLYIEVCPVFYLHLWFILQYLYSR